ncbi:UDP-N-acetylmuramate dehydrogenase [Lachnospiraceae bacterium]|nr:UDP-N-acetylmuramate dehydrogenase [Lachnospiraceae bacterium]
MSEYFFDYLKTLIPEERIRRNELMSKHTTFRVGGPADFFITPESTEELSALVRYLNLVDREYMIVGNGSNLLVGDHGYRGVIIRLGESFRKVEVDGNQITAGGGAMLASVAEAACASSLTGMEFAAGIPGTVGGAMVMNAGAYGSEMKDVVVSVDLMTPDGEIVRRSCEEMKFAYRRSILHRDDSSVISTVFTLKEGQQDTIRGRMNELMEMRRAKQPLNFPSAGSTFKRPEGFFAGKLIMDAGLGGYMIGGARVSEKHCGFVVNAGNATAADILDLIHEVQEKVQERFDVRLEPEVRIVGEF